MKDLTLRNDKAHVYLKKVLLSVRPDPLLTIDKWADTRRYLSQESSAEPGLWRTSRTPYLREIMEVLSPCNLDYNTICFLKGTQIGGSEVGYNFIGSIIDMFQGPTLLVMPTVADAQDVSKQRIAKMLSESPCFAGRVSEEKSRVSGNTILLKEFPGGFLGMVGANSASRLRSKTIKYLICDEVSAYPDDVGGEGDTFNIVVKRTNTYKSKKKIYIPSTPTIEGECRISAIFETSDKRYYMIPCPMCGTYQKITWDRMRWEKDKPKTAALECEVCNKLIVEHKKTEMLEAGFWQKTCESEVAGFHLSALYSPYGWFSWKQAAEEYIAAAHFMKSGDSTKMKTWVNTVKAEAYGGAVEKVDVVTTLLARRSVYEQDVPDKVKVLTAFVDVQDNRFECEVVGWCDGEESYSIEYWKLVGDLTGAEVWDTLQNRLNKTYKGGQNKVYDIRLVGIDSGGHFTDEVYKFCRRQPLRLIPTKGHSTRNNPVVKFPKLPTDKGVYLTMIGTDTAKEIVYNRYALENPGPGYCHFPTRPEYTEDHFKQLSIEKKRKKYDKGKLYYEWFVNKGNANEASDCRVGNFAIIRILQESLGVLLENMQVSARVQDNISSDKGLAQALPEKIRKRRVRSRGIR